MKSASFDFVAPTTVAEVITCLDAAGTGGYLLAGGQSLMPLIHRRDVTPRLVIDLGRVPELNHITAHVDGGVVIGATTTQRTAERSRVVAQRVPLLTKALAHVAHATIRNQGTVGGSIAFADPTAELPAAAVAANATMVVAGRDGRRAIPAAEFFLDRMTNSIREGEVLLEIYFPPLEAETYCGFAEFARRPGDIALAAAATVVQVSAAGRIVQARIVLSSVASTPIRAAAGEEMMIGIRPSASAFAQAGRVAAAGVEPPSDLHATGSYRRHLVAVLVRRALTESFAVPS